jgi:hypothetical protein
MHVRNQTFTFTQLFSDSVSVCLMNSFLLQVENWKQLCCQLELLSIAHYFIVFTFFNDYYSSYRKIMLLYALS